MRKTRIFQKDAYISIDFLEKELQIVKIKDAVKSNPNLSMVIKTNTGKDKIIYFENPEIIEESGYEAKKMTKIISYFQSFGYKK